MGRTVGSIVIPKSCTRARALQAELRKRNASVYRWLDSQVELHMLDGELLRDEIGYCARLIVTKTNVSLSLFVDEINNHLRVWQQFHVVDYDEGILAQNLKPGEPIPGIVHDKPQPEEPVPRMVSNSPTGKMRAFEAFITKIIKFLDKRRR